VVSEAAVDSDGGAVDSGKNPRTEKRGKRYHGVDMAHSVIITTPLPTLDEIGKRLGLSNAEQEYIISLVDEKLSRQSMGNAR
jgi:hypothetical protein